MTAIAFKSRLCGACRDTPGLVRAAAPEIPLVSVDVGAHPALVQRLGLVETPTLLLVDARGRIRYARAGNPTRDELATYVQEARDSLGVPAPPHEASGEGAVKTRATPGEQVSYNG